VSNHGVPHLAFKAARTVALSPEDSSPL
jgi:hypothetical protein